MQKQKASIDNFVVVLPYDKTHVNRETLFCCNINRYRCLCQSIVHDVWVGYIAHKITILQMVAYGDWKRSHVEATLSNKISWFVAFVPNYHQQNWKTVSELGQQKKETSNAPSNETKLDIRNNAWIWRKPTYFKLTSSFSSAC